MTFVKQPMSFQRCFLPAHNFSNDQIAFKIYLNITPTVTSWASDDKSFSLVFDENPLADFVELPEDGPYEKLWYSNILCGVIRGALEMVIAFA